MEIPITDRPAPELTVDYQSAGASVGRLPLALATDSGLATADDLRTLLQRRLRFLVIVFAVYYAVVLLVRLVHPGKLISKIDDWATPITVVILLGLLALLSSRRRMPLRQLRLIEFVFFGILAARVLMRGYLQFWQRDYIGHVQALIAAGDVENAREMLFGLAHRLMMVSTLFVVAYGVIIPNTWRRCAVVVAVFTALPIAIWIVACIARGLPTDYWFTFGFTISFLMSVQIAVLSVYGSYRIESSRQEAAEARRLGQYVLGDRLGAGGMGEVYRAEHVLLRRPCALKVIRPERAGDPKNLRRFEREVQVTATLTHPNTVQIFDYGHATDGTFYYVMEYLPGLTLEELVQREGALPPARAIHFLRQVCGALREAHGRGLIHRDIKPGNVMVCERGGIGDVAKLLDFGLVQPPVGETAGEKLTQDGTVTGTPAYLSPEQAGGQETLDARSDIYSVGALAYFLLTEKPPFAGRSKVKVLAAHLYEVPAALPAGVPADLAAVVMRCLAKAPTDRWPDAASLEAALAAVAVPAWTAADAGSPSGRCDA